MKLVRFGPSGAEKPGILDAAGAVRDASCLVGDWSGSSLDAGILDEIAKSDLSKLPMAAEGSRLGSPIAMPGKIVCVGLNYADHAAETGFELPKEPLVFFKSPTVLISAES